MQSPIRTTGPGCVMEEADLAEISRICQLCLEWANNIETFNNTAKYNDVEELLNEWPYGKLKTGGLREALREFILPTTCEGIGILAFSPASHPLNQWEALLQSIRSFRIVLPDPISSDYLSRCRSAQINPANLCSWFQYLVRFEKKSARIFGGDLKCAVTLIDDESSPAVLVHPYWPNRSGHFSPMIALGPRDTGYDLFRKYFEEQWAAASAERFEAITSAKPEQLAANVASAFRLMGQDKSDMEKAGTGDPTLIAGLAREDFTYQDFVGHEEALIVLDRTMRPSLLITRDNIDLTYGPGQPVVVTELVKSLLDNPHIGPAIVAVGRVQGYGEEEWWGTAWMVSADVAVTTRHVATEFARPVGNRYVLTLDAFVDFTREHVKGGHQMRPVRVQEVLHMDNTYDVAFLRLEQPSDRALPAPIKLATIKPTQSVVVACVGYPGEDTRETQPNRSIIFGDGPYGVKRIAPGRLSSRIDISSLVHDCSTLGGNSGSVLLNVKTGLAEGLHYGYADLQKVTNVSVPAGVVARLLDEVLTRMASTPPLEHAVREAISLTTQPLAPGNLIWPIFIKGDDHTRQAVPEASYLSVDEIEAAAPQIAALGLHAVLLFGAPSNAQKTETGEYASRADGLVQRAIRKFKEHAPSLRLITDVCVCAYTNEGQCILRQEQGVSYDNQRTMARLVKIAESHTEAGADALVLSGVVPGQIRAVKQALASKPTRILAYSKMASCLYGPYRAVIGSPLGATQRKPYQLDPSNKSNILRSIRDHMDEGISFPIVKPALLYLDIVSAAKQLLGDIPLAVYCVSGEQVMLDVAAKSQVIDKRAVMTEMLQAFRRAGADYIITYSAREICGWLKEGAL